MCVCVRACVRVFVCVVTDDVGNRLITVTVCQVIVCLHIESLPSHDCTVALAPRLAGSHWSSQIHVIMQ